jgi:hypothetical protein
LGESLDGLQRRLRLALQLEGEPRGALYPVEVRMRSGRLFPASPRWVRFGTPQAVAAARARLLLDGDVLEPTLEFTVRLLPAETAAGALDLEGSLELPTGLPEHEITGDQRLRMTVASPVEGGSARIEHRGLTGAALDGRISVSDRLLLDGETAAVGIVIEHLATGDWGMEILELPGK